MPKRPTFTSGTTPKAVIDAHARKHCGEQTHFPMTLVSQLDWTALAAAWNEGIDSHLEALTTRSTADEKTGQVRVHVEELSVLCRRLQEVADESANDQNEPLAAAAEQLRGAIIECIGIEEI